MPTYDVSTLAAKPVAQVRPLAALTSQSGSNTQLTTATFTLLAKGVASPDGLPSGWSLSSSGVLTVPQGVYRVVNGVQWNNSASRTNVMMGVRCVTGGVTTDFMQTFPATTANNSRQSCNQDIRVDGTTGTFQHAIQATNATSSNIIVVSALNTFMYVAKIANVDGSVSPL